MSTQLVSCIIVTYNSEKYISTCLQSLEKAINSSVEIIVVDNGSTDKTREVCRRHKNVRFYQNTENTGYAGGHAFGMEKAKGSYYFLMNPDTNVTEGFLDPLMKKMNADQKVAACQPVVYLTQDPKKINLTGKVTHFAGFDWIRDYRATVRPRSGEIISCSGSGVLFRASAMKDIGGFDTSYFMYYEDTDVSWRLRLYGYTLWYCAESVIFHEYKLVPDEQYQALKQKLFWAERNRLATIYKNYSLRTLILLFPILLFLECALFVYCLLKGWFGVKVRTYWSLWQSRHVLSANRSLVQRERVVSDATLARPFVSKIDFVLFDNPIVQWIVNPLLSLYWRLLYPAI